MLQRISNSAILRIFTRNPSRVKLIKSNINKIYVANKGLPSRSSVALVNESETQKEDGLAKLLTRNCFNVFTMTASYAQSEEQERLFTPPESVRGMKILDRDAFKTKVLVPSLKIPCKSIATLSKTLKKSLIKVIGIKAIADLHADDPDQKDHKLFLFNPKKYTSVDNFEEHEKEALAKGGVDLKTWEFLELELNYDNWMQSDILSAVLPKDSEGVAGFSQIGHIIHLNLRDELIEYKHIVGQVLLDKIGPAKTVVNKSNIIDNTYRNFKMEVVAGENNFVTQCREHGCTFEFDFSQVYWNPRLATEHTRIVSLLKPKDIVYDVFAGVGPFAIPASKKKCIVLANDLNPESYKWLQHNIKLNKIKSEIYTFNMDGRDFITRELKQDLIQRWRIRKEVDYSMHVIMNLPALAVEFLDAFRGLLVGTVRESFQNVILPTVHCYSFSKCDNKEVDVQMYVEERLGCPLPEGYTIRTVRNVAPNKDMLCATFTLSEDILYEDTDTCGPPEKKQKADSQL